MKQYSYKSADFVSSNETGIADAHIDPDELAQLKRAAGITDSSALVKQPSLVAPNNPMHVDPRGNARKMAESKVHRQLKEQKYNE
jgi:hypothetical protein